VLSNRSNAQAKFTGTLCPWTRIFENKARVDHGL